MTPPSHNPFSHKDVSGSPVVLVDAPGHPRALPQQVERVERVEKPWGHEEVFAVRDGLYVGKILHITAGAALSLQMHHHKDETIAVQRGRITLEHGPDAAHLQSVTLAPGERLRIPAGVVHRITAVSDSRVLEASTALEGWRHDIVRFEDVYGREGTSAP